MSSLEQDRGRADIRSERSQGGRSERSRGNMPVACLSRKRYFGRVLLQKRLPLCAPSRGFMMPPALREQTHPGSRCWLDPFILKRAYKRKSSVVPRKYQGNQESDCINTRF